MASKYDFNRRRSFSCDDVYAVARRIWNAQGGEEARGLTEREMLEIARERWLACSEPPVPSSALFKSRPNQNAAQLAQEGISAAYDAVNAYDCEGMSRELERARRGFSQLAPRTAEEKRLAVEVEQGVKRAETMAPLFCRKEW